MNAWFLYTMESHEIIRKYEIMQFAIKWIELDDVVLNRVR